MTGAIRLALLTTAAGILFCAAPAAAAPMSLPALARPDLTDMGAAPDTMPVTLSLTLAYRDQAGLDQLVTAQATPGSPLFHHYLTPEEFAARFAPSQEQADAVAAALTRAGFIVSQAPNRTVLKAIGTAAAAQAYFATTLYLVAQAGQPMLRYANATPATIPAELAGSVRSVLGLDNVVKMHSARRRGQLQPHEAAASAALVQPVTGPSGGILPAGFAAAYKFPKVSGAGHAIGVVIDSDIADSDLASFWAAAKVTRTGTFNRVLVEGTNPGIGPDVGETAIDTEATSSLAPGAAIYVYLMTSLSDTDIADAYNRAVTDHAVDVVSSSFGGCESEETASSTATNAIAEQGAAVGITFTASTGDAGGYCRSQNSMGAIVYRKDIVNSPASNPYFVAVGGTTLTINGIGTRVSETAWGPGGASGGGTGGVSSLFAKPSYQNGVTGMAVVPTITASDPLSQPKSGFAGRNVPDISLDASNASTSCMAVYDSPDGGWACYGGTSVSNPVFAALVALQNAVKGSKAGFANPALYSDFTKAGTSPAGVYGAKFFDVLRGPIGGGWAAKRGYDQATGIGSVTNGSF